MDMNAFYKMSYGLYVVSSRKGGRKNGQISNTVFQAAAEPPLVVISVSKENLTHEYINESKVFSISILSRNTPMTFIGSFGFRSGRDMDKFKGIDYKTGMTGAPVVLENSVAYLEAKVVNAVDLGTHTLFIGEIVNAETLKEEESMTYSYYRDVKHGHAPKAAPTYAGKPGV
ncbi:MAG: flavin reductase [Deltaproteobacteria bacterium]|nr:flavin reductase [Deltaproteobacteria bacterium]